MTDHVSKVLSDLKRVYPEYDPRQGYELAGFIWFQGWNDMVDRGNYPNRDRPDGYDKYSELPRPYAIAGKPARRSPSLL